MKRHEAPLRDQQILDGKQIETKNDKWFNPKPVEKVSNTVNL